MIQNKYIGHYAQKVKKKKKEKKRKHHLSIGYLNIKKILNE